MDVSKLLYSRKKHYLSVSSSANSANGARQSKIALRNPFTQSIQYYWTQFAAYLDFNWVNATENLLFVGKWGFKTKHWLVYTCINLTANKVVWIVNRLTYSLGTCSRLGLGVRVPSTYLGHSNGKTDGKGDGFVDGNLNPNPKWFTGDLVHIEKVKTDNITRQALCYHI